MDEKSIHKSTVTRNVEFQWAVYQMDSTGSYLRCGDIQYEKSTRTGALEKLLQDPSIKLITWSGRCDACAIRNTYQTPAKRFGGASFSSCFDLQATWMWVQRQFNCKRNALGIVIQYLFGGDMFKALRDKIQAEEELVQFSQYWNRDRLRDDQLNYVGSDTIGVKDLLLYLVLEYPTLVSWLGRSSIDEKLAAIYREVTGVDFESAISAASISNIGSSSSIQLLAANPVTEAPFEELPSKERSEGSFDVSGMDKATSSTAQQSSILSGKKRKVSATDAR